jgi:nitrate/nitrite transporter NarK
VYLVTGKNADERLFCAFAMLLGGGIFAYGITYVSSIYNYFCFKIKEPIKYINEMK